MYNKILAIFYIHALVSVEGLLVQGPPQFKFPAVGDKALNNQKDQSKLADKGNSNKHEPEIEREPELAEFQQYIKHAANTVHVSNIFRQFQTEKERELQPVALTKGHTAETWTESCTQKVLSDGDDFVTADICEGELRMEYHCRELTMTNSQPCPYLPTVFMDRHHHNSFFVQIPPEAIQCSHPVGLLVTLPQEQITQNATTFNFASPTLPLSGQVAEHGTAISVSVGQEVAVNLTPDFTGQSSPAAMHVRDDTVVRRVSYEEFQEYSNGDRDMNLLCNGAAPAQVKGKLGKVVPTAFAQVKSGEPFSGMLILIIIAVIFALGLACTFASCDFFLR